VNPTGALYRIDKTSLPGTHRVFAATRLSDGASVVVKRAPGPYPSPEDVGALRHEWTVLKRLEGAKVAHAVDFISERGAVRLPLSHGTAPVSPFIYALYGVTHHVATGDYERAYQFGRLALDLAARPEHVAARSGVKFVFAALVSPWARPLWEGYLHFEQAVVDGLDVRDLAEAHGLPAASSRDLVDALFAPALSTRERVTAISGRGIGLDVVRTEVEHLSGRVEVTSERGRGTLFRVRLPLEAIGIQADADADAPAGERHSTGAAQARPHRPM
jgi:hypothetical protein